MEWKDLWKDGRIFVFEDGSIVIWCEGKPEGKVSSAWLRDGQLAVPLKYLKSQDFKTVYDELLKAEKSGYFWCGSCGAQITEETCAGEHFAGRWCLPCWEDYVKANSTRCGICGQPRWACVC